MASKTLTIIEKDGKVQKDKDPNLADEQLLELYAVMVQTRILDARGLALQRQGRIGFFLQSLGQEASHVGSAAALRDSDWLFPAYRQVGITLLRGAPLDQIVAEWFGHVGDTSKGRQMPVHYSFRCINFVSISSPIGTQISHAAGAANGRQDPQGGHGLHDPLRRWRHELERLPRGAELRRRLQGTGACLSARTTSGRSRCHSSSRPAAETIGAKAQAYGMPGVRVDGNDVLAVYRVCKEAVDRARKGDGPTMVETVTYRMASHSSSDDASALPGRQGVRALAAARPDPALPEVPQAAQASGTRAGENEITTTFKEELATPR